MVALAPPLSVILPVHDARPFVAESVRSILDQSFGDFELVIGDDGSSDGSSAMLTDFAAADPRIRLLRRESASGLAASAAWLVGETRAPIVAVAHADDRAHKLRFERQMAVLAAAADVDLVGTLWDGIDEAGQVVRPADYWRLLRPSRFAPFSHSSIMFRKAAFDAAGGYRPENEYWEDLDLYYRIAARGEIAVVPQALSTVRHSRISTKYRRDAAQFETAVETMYRSSAHIAGGGDAEAVSSLARPGEKVTPLAFLSYGSTLLWAGQRPRVLRRMLKRARLRADAATIHALLWVLWAEISPATLRAALRRILHLRNRVARPILSARSHVPWRPLRRTER